MKIKSITYKHHAKAIPVYDVINAHPQNNFIVSGNTCNVVLHNCVVFDECNFGAANIKDVEKTKKKMKDKYDTLVARVTGTFVKNGEVFGKLYVISSKNSDSDFMEDYVQKQKEAGNKHMYVFDKSQWEVWPKSKYSSDKMFNVALGGKHLRSFVVPDDTSEEGLRELKQQGYQLLQVPEDNKTRFLSDLDVALRDIAGVSVPGSMSFISQYALDECIGTRKNPFYNDVVQIGTKDNYTLEEFFHLEAVDESMKKFPMYIHLDLSLSTDRTGISGVVISGRQDVKSGEKTISVPTFSHVFSVALEAPRGDKIPYPKITAFIVWLRANKFNIAGITRDQFQSEYMAQLLEEQGFGEVPKASLDRTPDGYDTLKSVLLENRIDMLHCELLEHELTHLQRDSVSGKIDHPVGGCFTDDTLIKLADGSVCTIRSLLDAYRRGQVNYAYTINEATLEVEPKLIERVFRTKFVTNLMRVTFENGQQVKCTPDHRFMLPDGTYEEIQYLHPGDALMAIDSSTSSSLRITEISEIHKPCAVYDLTLRDNHNFALAAGPVVHNSKDIADSFAGAVWGAITDAPPVTLSAKSLANTLSAVNGASLRNQGLPSMMIDWRYKR